MITEQRAREFGIEQRRNDETVAAFRERVAEELRRCGHIIEAHEALSDRLYDDPDGNAMIGIIGAVAKTVQGRSYPGSEVGTDIAAGVVAQEPDDPLRDTLVLLMTGLGL